MIPAPWVAWSIRRIVAMSLLAIAMIHAPTQPPNMPPPLRRVTRRSALSGGAGQGQRRSRISTRLGMISLGVLLLVIAGAGCQRDLMPTPLMFQDAEVDPFAKAIETQTVIPVFYATDRKQNGPVDVDYGYTAKRETHLTIGVCDVAIGDGMAWPELRKQSRKRPRSRLAIPLLVVGTRPIGSLWTTLPLVELPEVLRRELVFGHRVVAMLEKKSDLSSGRDGLEELSLESQLNGPVKEYASRINAQLEQSDRRDILIFVHGYRNGFSKAVSVAAELWHYTGRQGVAIAYSWPARKDLWGYVHDRESAQYTAGHFRRFLLYLAGETRAERIHIVCHSTGAEVVSTALRELRLMGHNQPIEALKRRLKLGRVVFVAPDLDLMIAKKRNFGEQFHQLPETITVYVSREDKALNFARKVVYGLVRLGALQPDDLSTSDIAVLEQFPQVQMIDTAGLERFDFIGHSHHTRNPSVSSDLILTLCKGLLPEQRGLVRRNNGPVWIFPEDYGKRVRQIAQQVFGSEATDGPSLDG